MVIEVIVISIIIAFIRKGSIKNIENLKFKFWYLIIIGFLVQSIPAILQLFNNVRLNEIADEYSFIFVLISYILILIPLLFNMNKNGIFMVFSGTLLNAVVIFTNSFMMPVSLQAIKITGYEGVLNKGEKLDFMHNVMNDDTILKSLGDIIPLPEPYPMAQVISIGDIFICIGLFVFLQYVFVRKDSNLQVES